MKTSEKLIELFHCCITDTETTLPFDTVNLMSMCCGYSVEEGACNESSYRYFEKLVNEDRNSTFWNNWDEIIENCDYELRLAQLKHYMTTYGSDFSEGNGYVPNAEHEKIQFDFKELKVIKAVTPEEMYKKCMDILSSGAALKTDTGKEICFFIKDYALEKNMGTDEKDKIVNSVKNREAVIMLCDLFGIFPSDRFAIIRYIAYKATGIPNVIKSEEFLRNCKSSAIRVDLSMLSDEQIVEVSSIFYRYKDFLLMFKGKYDNSRILNRMRRLAKKYHTPLKKDIWDLITVGKADPKDVESRMTELPTVRIVRLCNAIMQKMSAINYGNSYGKMYVIRNGNVYFDMQKDSYNYNVTDIPSNLRTNYRLLYGELIRRLREKKCRVRYPKYIDIACPTSEKNFVGSIPFGSSMPLSQTDNVIGIYWQNCWGTRDFDLSFINTEDCKVGWDVTLKNADNTVIHSGDMTNASPEATELIYCKDCNFSGIVYVNRYCGREGSKFRLFVAQKDMSEVNTKMRGDRKWMNYMVDDSDIHMSAMCTSTSEQQMVGVIYKGSLLIGCLGNGKSITSGAKMALSCKDMVKATMFRLSNMLSIYQVFEDAGFTTVGPDEECDIDLNDCTSDAILSIFS